MLKKFKQSFEKVKFNAHGELARNITQHRAHSPTATQRESVGSFALTRLRRVSAVRFYDYILNLELKFSFYLKLNPSFIQKLHLKKI